jgi:excisionase family DNA binding protein
MVSELLTLQQAAQLLKVHPNTLRNWERAGLIPVVRVGLRRDRRFPKEAIHQLLPGRLPVSPQASLQEVAEGQVVLGEEGQTRPASGSDLQNSIPDELDLRDLTLSGSLLVIGEATFQGRVAEESLSPPPPRFLHPRSVTGGSHPQFR